MINTFIKDNLNFHNKLFINSVLSNAGSCCVWTYNVENLKKQTPFGVKIKNAEEIIPKIIMEEIYNIFPNLFIKYFKFAYLYDYGGCFCDPTIVITNKKLIKEIDSHENLIFCDKEYCDFLTSGNLDKEAFDKFIKVGKNKIEFSRDMFLYIENFIFKENKNPRLFFPEMNITYINKKIETCNQFYKKLYYSANEYKFQIGDDNQLTIECKEDWKNFPISDMNKIREKLKIIMDNLYYIDLSNFNLTNLHTLPTIIMLLIKRIQNSEFNIL